MAETTPAAADDGGSEPTEAQAEATAGAVDDGSSEPTEAQTPSPPPAVPKNPAGYSVIPLMNRSSLNFAISKDGGERVDGVFQVVLGGFHLDPTDLSEITGQLNVELGSINTGNEVRDKNIADVFFGRAAGKTVHGNVEFLKITPGVKALGVGKSTVAEAHLRITIGSHGSSTRVPVSLSRPSEEEWLLETMEPVSLSIRSLEMTGPAAALKELCGHESIGDLVEVDAAIHLVPTE